MLNSLIHLFNNITASIDQKNNNYTGVFLHSVIESIFLSGVYMITELNYIQVTTHILCYSPLTYIEVFILESKCGKNIDVSKVGTSSGISPTNSRAQFCTGTSSHVLHIILVQRLSIFRSGKKIKLRSGATIKF